MEPSIETSEKTKIIVREPSLFYILLLCIIPFAIDYFSWPFLPSFFFSIAFGIYLERRNIFNFNRAALDIATEPDLLRAVRKFTPSWFVNSDVERAHWLNRILKDVIWPLVEDYGKEKLTIYLNDVLKDLRLNFLQVSFSCIMIEHVQYNFDICRITTVFTFSTHSRRENTSENQRNSRS